jgi:hypothetical protein
VGGGAQRRDLVGQACIGAGALALGVGQLAVEVVQRREHRLHQRRDRLLARFQIEHRLLLQAGERGAGEIEEGGAIVVQRLGGDRLKGVPYLLRDSLLRCVLRRGGMAAEPERRGRPGGGREQRNGNRLGGHGATLGFGSGLRGSSSSRFAA